MPETTDSVPFTWHLRQPTSDDLVEITIGKETFVLTIDDTPLNYSLESLAQSFASTYTAIHDGEEVIATIHDLHDETENDFGFRPGSAFTWDIASAAPTGEG